MTAVHQLPPPSLLTQPLEKKETLLLRHPKKISLEFDIQTLVFFFHKLSHTENRAASSIASYMWTSSTELFLRPHRWSSYFNTHIILLLSLIHRVFMLLEGVIWVLCMYTCTDLYYSVCRLKYFSVFEKDVSARWFFSTLERSVKIRGLLYQAGALLFCFVL